MKKIYYLLSFIAIIIITSCQKEHASKEANARAPLLEIAQAENTCMANPLLFPSPGAKITLTSSAASYFLPSSGTLKVWAKKSGSATWSGYVLNSSMGNPIVIPYASFTPALGSIPAGTVVHLAITGNYAGACPGTPCETVSGPNYASVITQVCKLSPR